MVGTHSDLSSGRGGAAGPVPGSRWRRGARGGRRWGRARGPRGSGGFFGRVPLITPRGRKVQIKDSVVSAFFGSRDCVVFDKSGPGKCRLFCYIEARRHPGVRRARRRPHRECGRAARRRIFSGRRAPECVAVAAHLKAPRRNTPRRRPGPAPAGGTPPARGSRPPPGPAPAAGAHARPGPAPTAGATPPAGAAPARRGHTARPGPAPAGGTPPARGPRPPPGATPPRPGPRPPPGGTPPARGPRPPPGAIPPAGARAAERGHTAAGARRPRRRPVPLPPGGRRGFPRPRRRPPGLCRGGGVESLPMYNWGPPPPIA